MEHDLAGLLDAAFDEMEIEIATSVKQIREAQRLRYKVYCEGEGYEAGENGLETDPFDESSRHVLVRARASGDVLGTVRVVLGTGQSGHSSFPMNRVCDRDVLAPLPIPATGEISRFALARERPGVSPASAGLMRLFLMRGIVEVSGLHKLTHWCALMEQSLLRLLRSSAIHFQHVGPTIEFRGRRQPSVATIGTLLDRIQLEKPQIWNFITDQGALWMEPEEQALAVSWLPVTGLQDELLQQAPY
ncbi:MAG: GNAT family N-acetyltransferase [Acetobacteraceae bacterium]|nr:GNAT family N-acetyltransferase [Acetobacteraceae bacterium]